MRSIVRRVSQSVRHLPLLGAFTPLWNALRRPYLSFLTILAKRSGIGVTVGGVLIRIHPLFATQSWETIEMESYRRFVEEVRPGDVIYDVGAHIGTYTIISSKKVGPTGRVVAYEPHDYTRALLVQHLEWNKCDGRTIVRPLSCGAEPGTADFYYVPDQAEGMSGFVPVDGFEKRSVEVTTLDDEVSRLGLIPTLIKIDVEGGEWEVLRGAESTLRQYRPRLLLSLHPLALGKLRLSPDEVLRWLVEREYRYEIIAVDHEIHVFAQSWG